MDSSGTSGPRPERVFLALALSVGVWLAVVTPPHDAPDEPRHLQRVWLLSEGRIVLPGSAPGEGGAVPASLFGLHPEYRGGTLSCRHRPDEILTTLGTSLAPKRISDAIPTPILYGPAGYVAPALVVAPARWLGLGAGGLFYLARLANLAAWVLLCSFAIALTPSHRWTLVTAALLPMSLFEASTISADAMTNALGLVLLALTLRLAAPGTERSRRQQQIGFVVLVALLGLGKPGYSLLGLLSLGIPPERLGGGWRYCRFVLVVIAVGIAVPAVWWMMSQPEGAVPFPRADPAAQLAGIVREPGRFVSAVGLTLAERAGDYARGAVGVLGRLDVGLPDMVYAGYGILLVAVAVAGDRSSPRLPAATRWVAAGVAVLGVCTIAALLYVSATPLAAGRVLGIQGRYFLPFVPLVLVALPPLFDIRPFHRWLVVFASGLGLVLTSGAVWLRYYGE